MRNSLILPVAFGSIFAALATAQARPVQPGLFLTGQTETQVQAITVETARVHPMAEVYVSFDLGRRAYTVEVKPREAGQESGGAAAGEGGAD